MSACKIGVLQFLSGQWVYLATALHGVSQIDQIRMAKDALASSIMKIKEQEGGLRGELLLISKKVRGMDRGAMKNAVTLQLKRSRYLRQQLAMLSNKRSALEQHLDTLDTSELNQQVITSMKQTSSALKSMGLDQAQTQADGLLMDMEENMQDMHNITKILSTPIQEDMDFDANVFENELSLLLMDDDEEITCTNITVANTIATVNTMNTPADQSDAGVHEDSETPAELDVVAMYNN